MPFDDAITYMCKMAQDSSATATTFLKLMYNVGYKIILVEFGRQVTESDSTTDLEEGRRSYQVAPDCQWPKTLELIDGSNSTPLGRIDSSDQWAAMKSGNMQGQPTHYHYKPRFGVGGGVVELYPIPSSDDYDLFMVYETRDKDLAQTAYIAGTVTLTEDDATVTGAGTAFTAAMEGRYLIPTTAGTDGQVYRVASYTNATSIELENNYAGETQAGVSYKIVEIPNLPEDMHIIPCYFALEQWWSSQGNPAKQKEFKDNWVIGMARAKKTHSVTSRGGIINPGGMGSPFPGNPSYFPTTITE